MHPKLLRNRVSDAAGTPLPLEAIFMLPNAPGVMEVAASVPKLPSVAHVLVL